MQLRSVSRDHIPAKYRNPTARFTVSVARGPDVLTVRSLTELCGLQVTVESTWLQRVNCNTSAASVLDMQSVPERGVWGLQILWWTACPTGRA